MVFAIINKPTSNGTVSHTIILESVFMLLHILISEIGSLFVILTSSATKPTVVLLRPIHVVCWSRLDYYK